MAGTASKTHANCQTGSRFNWRGELATLRLATRSPYPYMLALVALLAVTLVYQSNRRLEVRVGGGYDAPYVRGFYDREGSGATAFRWASSRARVLLPGAGARDAALVVRAGARPDGISEPVTVVVNGITLGQFAPTIAPSDFTFSLPARDYSYGNLTIDLLSSGHQIRTRGTQALTYGPRVVAVAVEPEPGMGVFKPPLAVLVAWVTAIPLLYLLLYRIGTRARYAAAVSAAFVVGLAAAADARRLDLAIFAPRLTFLVAVAYLLVLCTGYLVPKVFASAGVTVSRAAWRLLLLVFLFVYVLKLGGIAYPQLVVIDQPWHDQQFQKVLLGRFWELYRPSDTGISGIPGQWGINAQIPYSPFLYLLGLPLYLAPVGRELSINFWSGLFDVSRIFAVFLLARLLGAKERGALVAAFIIGVTPATFLLHSWGNYPTTLSLYVALLFITLFVAAWDRLQEPRVFAGLTCLLTLSMLLYTVTAVFIGLFLLLLVAALAWPRPTHARSIVRPAAALLVVSSTLAFFLFYVQYVGPLLTATLPAFGAELAAGRALGGSTPPLQSYVTHYLANLWNYGVLLLLLVAPFGWAALARRPRHPLALPLLGAWFGVFLIFAVAGSKIDMVSKEVWFVLPAVAMSAGLALDDLLDRWSGRVAKLGVALFLGQLTGTGVLLWVVRIVTVRH